MEAGELFSPSLNRANINPAPSEQYPLNTVAFDIYVYDFHQPAWLDGEMIRPGDGDRPQTISGLTLNDLYHTLGRVYSNLQHITVSSHRWILVQHHLTLVGNDSALQRALAQHCSLRQRCNQWVVISVGRLPAAWTQDGRVHHPLALSHLARLEMFAVTRPLLLLPALSPSSRPRKLQLTGTGPDLPVRTRSPSVVAPASSFPPTPRVKIRRKHAGQFRPESEAPLPKFD